MPRSRTRSRSPVGRGRRSKSPRSSRHNRRRSKSRDRNRRRREEREESSRKIPSRADDRPDRIAAGPSYASMSTAGEAEQQQQWDSLREKRKKQKDAAMAAVPSAAMALTDKDFEGKSQEEIDMMKIMGFSGFDTSKNKKVKGNNVGDVHVVMKRKYRQYMNRKGGFNRPLDYVH